MDLEHKNKEIRSGFLNRIFGVNRKPKKKEAYWVKGTDAGKLYVDMDLFLNSEEFRSIVKDLGRYDIVNGNFVLKENPTEAINSLGIPNH